MAAHLRKVGMQDIQRIKETASKTGWSRICRMVGLAIAATGACLLSTGCGTDYSPKATSTSKNPQTYLAPWVVGGTNASVKRYVIDNSAATVTQITGAGAGQIQNYGSFITSARGLLNITLTSNGTAPYGTPQTDNWAVVLPDSSGGLVQLKNQPAAPLVNAASCPNLKSAQTYQFFTIPASLTSTVDLHVWTKQETAYGSVDISTSGGTVNFANIKQYTLPSVGGTPTYTATASESGACTSTSFGHTISIPATATVYDPGSGSQAQEAVAFAGIGASGLLVEDGGTGSGAPPYYNPVLGAGTGAIGLPKPSSALDTSALRSAQYLSFAYGAGYGRQATGWSPTATSFGFATQPASCSALAAQITAQGSTLANPIYGGDFPNNDPSTSTDGYGNCDMVVDLGTQDASNNGLYPNAMVWMGVGFTANTSKATYSFPAVAIAGKLRTKYAIFLIGLDSTQPWGIYLLQSN